MRAQSDGSVEVHVPLEGVQVITSSAFHVGRNAHTFSVGR